MEGKGRRDGVGRRDEVGRRDGVGRSVEIHVLCVSVARVQCVSCCQHESP